MSINYIAKPIFDYIKNNFYLTEQLTLASKTTSVKSKQLTVTGMCLALNIKPCTYSLVYNNKRKLGPSMIIKINAATGMSIEQIKGILQCEH